MDGLLHLRYLACDDVMSVSLKAHAEFIFLVITLLCPGSVLVLALWSLALLMHKQATEDRRGGGGRWTLIVWFRPLTDINEANRRLLGSPRLLRWKYRLHPSPFILNASDVSVDCECVRFRSDGSWWAFIRPHPIGADTFGANAYVTCIKNEWGWEETSSGANEPTRAAFFYV